MSTIYKGGYVSIDLENLDISSAKTFSGLYAKLLDAKGKPFIFKNVNDGTYSYETVQPSSVQYAETNEILMYAYIGVGIQLIITSDDEVSYTIVE